MRVWHRWHLDAWWQFARLLRGNWYSAVGNACEWYDFCLYGYFAIVLSRVFFPNTHPQLALLATLLFYAVGFLARPLGGIIFAHFGDSRGHVRGLYWAVNCISLPTVLLGLLPGYATIGMWAPALLVLLRILQGICAGGQYVGAMIVLSESSPEKARAVGCSISHVTALLGYLAAVLIGVMSLKLVAVFSHAGAFADTSWAWRLPFLAAAGLWLITWGARRQWQMAMHNPAVAATDTDTAAAAKVKSPLWFLWRYHRRALYLSTGLSAVMGVLYTTVFVYMGTFMQNTVGFSLSQVLLINAAGLVLSCMLVPWFARLADVYGRRPLMIWGFGLLLITIWPTVLIMLNGSYGGALAASCWQVALVTLLIAAAAVTYCELFPHNVRYTGCAISYNIGVALFGGMTPFVLHALLAWTQRPLCVVYYIVAACLCGAVLVYFLPETRGLEHGLQEVPAANNSGIKSQAAYRV